MNSAEDLYNQILHSDLSTDERAQLRCRLAKQLEEVGKYEPAGEAMGELWSGIGSPPILEGLTERTKGEVLLRIGSLTGWLGTIRQIEGAQEIAKNLLSESIAIFESLQDAKRVAEAQTEIAVCYKREGALDNARVWFAEALSRLTDEDGDLKAVALLRSAVLEQLANRLNDALNILTISAPLFQASTNHTLKGRFHNEFAMVLEELGAIESRDDYLDRALIEYSAASFHFDEAGNTRYQACVENNLAMIFLKLNRFAESHEHLDRAQALFTQLKDNVHLAQVDETRARVMLAEGDVAKAAKFAKSAVQTLDKGDEPSLLAEALTTYGTALSRLHDEGDARQSFQRAIAVAEQAGDLESAGIAALTLFEELANELSDDEICEVLEPAYEFLRDTKNAATRNRLMHSGFRALSLIHAFQPDLQNFSIDKTLHRHEARYIKFALEKAGGNISKAARLLGLPHNTNLHYMLKNAHKNLRVGRATISGQEVNPDQNASGRISEAPKERIRAFKILHVEDDLTVAGVVREMVEHEGWAIEHLIEGNAALEELASDAQYDLLLVDHDLPGLSGLQLIEDVRSMFHRRYMPILMMSGTLDEDTARRAGADAFLRKPQDIGLLVETIGGLLSSVEDEES